MNRSVRIAVIWGGLGLLLWAWWAHQGPMLLSESFRAQGGPTVDDEALSLVPAPDIIEYEVQPGETLEQIAARFGVSVEALVGSNANTVDNLHSLEPGTILKIVKNGVLHAVKPGQTLTDIARTYGVPLAEIVHANRLEDREYIYPGEEFFIPGAVRSPTWTYLQMAGGRRSLFAWPVRGVLSSGFGTRIHPISGEPHFHQGIDIEVPEGTEVYAASAGKVLVAGRHSGYGLYIVLQHSHGYRTLYAHLAEIGVYRGQFVEGGQVIGRSGNTGNSTGPHLHFEILQYGRPLNPLALLPP
ncbi:MAG: M23 family metallopeptidase [Candidatus Bipolaricaulota bacterium]|nr:M23 family metallopeptidase [Candidatus Bipolaricaulota bacterium]MDW8031714.1 M23 family metallopeptidase [Candidatus Bipolaricaulota bacterium]